jgi:hypothetical protein
MSTGNRFREPKLRGRGYILSRKKWRVEAQADLSLIARSLIALMGLGVAWVLAFLYCLVIAPLTIMLKWAGRCFRAIFTPMQPTFR